MADTPETPKPAKPETSVPGPVESALMKSDAAASDAQAKSKSPERRVSGGSPAPADALAGSSYTPPRPKRTSSEIRADIDAQREQLGQNVDHLRDRVTELTDWRGQLMKHRKKIVVGAVATGFVVGGLMALRRR